MPLPCCFSDMNAASMSYPRSLPGALHPPMINSNVTEGDRGARNGYVVPAAAARGEWGGYAVLAVTR